MGKDENINLLQKNLFVDFIFDNKYTLLSANANRFEKETKWNELVELLNNNGPPTKDVKKWKRVSFFLFFTRLFSLYFSYFNNISKVWQDLKKDVRLKENKIRAHSNQTGGGPQIELKLTDLEEKVGSICNDDSRKCETQLEEMGLQNSTLLCNLFFNLLKSNDLLYSHTFSFSSNSIHSSEYRTKNFAISWNYYVKSKCVDG